MPHFIVDCSQQILQLQDEQTILTRLHRVANASGLFEEPDIKVRLNAFATYAVGGSRDDFIHVFAWIMQGRSVEQRAALSKSVIEALSELFPQVPRIAINVAEFERATYFNRAML